MVLVDSSVWIEAERRRVDLRELLPRDEDVAVCPVIIQEVLRGSRSAARYAVAREILMACEILDAPTPLARFEEAARLYLSCRRVAITPSAMDSLIAACAIAHDLPLLAADNDFTHIARVVPQLRLVTRS